MQESVRKIFSEYRGLNTFTYTLISDNIPEYMEGILKHVIISEEYALAYKKKMRKIFGKYNLDSIQYTFYSQYLVKNDINFLMKLPKCIIRTTRLSSTEKHTKRLEFILEKYDIFEVQKYARIIPYEKPEDVKYEIYDDLSDILDKYPLNNHSCHTSKRLVYKKNMDLPSMLNQF